MLKDVVAVKPLDGYRIHVTFEDHVEGVLDVVQCVEFTGVFAPLRDPVYFATVRVHPELGVVCWENGADLDSDVLYGLVTDKPIDCRQSMASSK